MLRYDRKDAENRVILKKKEKARLHMVYSRYRGDKRFSSHRYFDRSHTRQVNLPRSEKSLDGGISRLENGPVVYATRRGTSRIVLRALRTKSILFSAIAPRSSHLRGWRNVTVDVRPDRVAASKTGYGESTTKGENNRGNTMGDDDDDDERRKRSRYPCVFRRKGNYSPGGTRPAIIFAP